MVNNFLHLQFHFSLLRDNQGTAQLTNTFMLTILYQYNVSQIIVSKSLQLH